MDEGRYPFPGEQLRETAPQKKPAAHMQCCRFLLKILFPSASGQPARRERFAQEFSEAAVVQPLSDTGMDSEDLSVFCSTIAR